MNARQHRLRPPAMHLADVCRECESVLQTAADVAESSPTRQNYRRRARAWGRLASSLSEAMERSDAEAPREFNASSTLQRAWIKIKSATGDSDAIAAECRQQEAQALRQLTSALDAELPVAIRAILERFAHHESITK